MREVMQKEFMPEQRLAIVNRLLADPADRAPTPTASSA